MKPSGTRLVITAGVVAGLLLVVLATGGIGAGAPANSKPEAPSCHGQPATWIGTPGPDRVPRTRGGVMVALGGADRFTQVGGTSIDVTVCLGAGSDGVHISEGGTRGSLFDLGAGADHFGTSWSNDLFGKVAVLGGPGDDRIEGGYGSDDLRAGPGVDAVFGGAKGDAIRLGAGNDHASGEGGSDRLDGGAGDDKIFGAQSDNGDVALQGDRADGGDGADECYAAVERRCEAG